ncbi:hypothetical protein Fleli_2947 [Bernardetia litoralis DSM 6794]|uniref:N-acetyltransferase domain-containing protein n=1 Tax=Bernardetia litoralis (strain ATCC 23117 / DSM 6794 / NBRC 15988 / NCIMB 1366 / Fx l1 / Sio-4) TaxID=880071 RepID=I4AMV9_BERLS|nr:hypothetical protein [Bernardetia litoralis]AFM05294.1 hypothetical protein Fleli_2947 [Bernardetia litoralis DSM 6794]
MNNRKSMNSFWLDMPEDVEVRQGCEPIDWAKLEPKTILDGKFVVREATEADLEGAAEAYVTGFPALKGCDFEMLFKPEGFQSFVGKGEAFNKGNNFLIVVEEVATKKIAAALIITMWKMLYRGELLVIAVNKDYQAAHLGTEITTVADKLFEDSGVEMCFGWCAAMHIASQTILKNLGYTPRAVVPGLYRLWAGEGEQYRRTVEVFFQKFYGGAEEMCTADINLLPEVEALLVPWRK